MGTPNYADAMSHTDAVGSRLGRKMSGAAKRLLLVMLFCVVAFEFVVLLWPSGLDNGWTRFLVAVMIAAVYWSIVEPLFAKYRKRRREAAAARV